MEGLIPVQQNRQSNNTARTRPINALWSLLRRWLKVNASVPRWFPAPLHRPCLAYFLAALFAVLAVSLDMLLMAMVPSFGLSSLVTLMAVVVIALTWGAGPSLTATLLGTALLDWLVLPQFSNRSGDPVRVLDNVMVLIVGLTVTAFTSRNMFERRNAERSTRLAERARKDAEELAASLAQEQARADLERKRLEAIFEAMADGVTFYDNEGRIQHLNAASLHLHGLEDPAVARSMSADERARRLQLRNAEGQPLPLDEWLVPRILKGEALASANARDYIITGLHGREVEVSMSGMPVRDAEGRIVGGVTVMRDVTEKRQLERRTHRAFNALMAIATVLVQAPDERVLPGEEATRQVAQHLAELTRDALACRRIALYSLDLERDEVSPLVMLGLAPEQEQRWWAGERSGSLLLDGSSPEIAARLRKGEVLVLDWNQPPLSGHPNPYQIKDWLVAPMRIGERLVGLIALDFGSAAHRYTAEEITLVEAIAKLGALVIERERLRQEREAARASELALREANRQMDAFLGVVSHELKTPLTSIILGLQMTQRRMRHLAQRAPDVAAQLNTLLEPLIEQLGRTNSQVDRLDRLVNDLLDVSRIQADKLEMRKTPVDLAGIVCEVVEEQRQVHPQRTLCMEMPAAPIPPVFADAARIGQVLTNYLTNALKYSAQDRPVQVGLEVTESQARVWVRDQGPGLSAAEQERIWERFYRAQNVEVQYGTGVGLGLGLSISRTIIEHHQGQVGVESAPGKGSTFWFSLPLASEEQSEQGSG